jgi:integrase
LVSTIYVAVRGTLHSLRHHFISHLVNNLREPITVAAQLAGHTKIETTMKYIHVMPDYAIRAMARFSLYEN